MTSVLRVACLIVPAMTALATTVVSVGNTTSCTSPPKALISLKGQGSPLGRARLDFYRKVENGERASLSLIADDHGTVRTPRLDLGQYRVFVDAGEQTGTIALTVTSDGTHGAVCELEFRPVLIVEHQKKEELADLAREAPRVWLTELRGVVEDQSRAVIPRAKIQVYREGALEKGPVAEIQTDEKGQFSVRLENGAYIATFAFPGFRTRAIAVEIGRADWQGVRVPMTVGGSPQAVNTPPIEWKSE